MEPGGTAAVSRCALIPGQPKTPKCGNLANSKSKNRRVTLGSKTQIVFLLRLQLLIKKEFAARAAQNVGPGHSEELPCVGQGSVATCTWKPERHFHQIMGNYHGNYAIISLPPFSYITQYHVSIFYHIKIDIP